MREIATGRNGAREGSQRVGNSLVTPEASITLASGIGHKHGCVGLNLTSLIDVEIDYTNYLDKPWLLPTPPLVSKKKM